MSIPFRVYKSCLFQFSPRVFGSLNGHLPLRSLDPEPGPCVQRSVLPSWFDIRAWLHYDEAKDLTFYHQQGSRQGKLRSQNLDEACLKRRYSVYFFKTTTQGSVVKVFDKNLRRHMSK